MCISHKTHLSRKPGFGTKNIPSCPRSVSHSAEVRTTRRGTTRSRHHPQTGRTDLSLKLFTQCLIATQVALLAAACSETSSTKLPGWIYFQAEKNEEQHVYRIRPDGRHKQVVFSGEEDAFIYSSGHTEARILLVTGRDGEHDIVSSGPQGESPKKIAPAPGLDWYPRLSPDGRWILFESARESYRDLYRVPVTGGKPERLTDNREGNFDGTWSPDGTRIAFVSSRHGQLDLFTMDADGRSQRRLTVHPGDSVKPVWSKDGASIFFISGRDGKDAVFRIQSDGKNLTRITPNGRAVTSFSLSPNGNQILYAVHSSETLWLYSTVTETNTRLGFGVNPSWSPDGNHITFAYQSNIYIMLQDGSGRTQITRGPGIDWRPLWLQIQNEEKQVLTGRFKS